MTPKDRMTSSHRSLENSIGLDMIYEEEAERETPPDSVDWEPSKQSMSTRKRRTTRRGTRRGKMPGAEFKLITQKLMELQRK